jgi:hypothetical protein
MKYLKLFSTACLVALQYFILVYPIQNSSSANQLQDTPTSTTNATMVSHLVTYSPVLTFILIILIWFKELAYLIDKYII